MRASASLADLDGRDLPRADGIANFTGGLKGKLRSPLIQHPRHAEEAGLRRGVGRIGQRFGVRQARAEARRRDRPACATGPARSAGRRSCRSAESAPRTRARATTGARTDLFPRRSVRGARAWRCDRRRRVSAVPACQMLPCRYGPCSSRSGRRIVVSRASRCARARGRSLSGAAGDPPAGRPLAIIAPHAGLMYSGPIAAHAYKLLYGHDIEIAVLVGPSHYVGFEGAAIYERGAFETPFGPVPIAEHCAAAVARASRDIGPHPDGARARAFARDAAAVSQARAPRRGDCADRHGISAARNRVRRRRRDRQRRCEGRKAVLVASTDLSHYQNAPQRRTARSQGHSACASGSTPTA